jgi:hypothetical protein
MTVGNMMLGILVTALVSPTCAWTGPTTTEPAPATTAVHPSQRG